MPFWDGFTRGASQAIDEQRAMGFKERESEKSRQGDISKLITAGLIGGDVTQAQQGEEGAFGVPTAPMKPRNIGEAIMQGFGLKEPQTGQEYYKRISAGKKWEPTSMQEAVEFEKAKTTDKEWKPTSMQEAIEFEKSKVGIKKGEGKTLVAPMVDKISKNEDAYYTLSSSLDTLNANADKFAQFMGPGRGVLRHPLRSYANKDLQDFLAWKANVQDAFQQYRVAVTGAQASDKEIALLAKNRPTENDTYEVFIKKTNEVRKIGNQVIKRYITNLNKSGYDTSGFTDTILNLDEEMSKLTSGQNMAEQQLEKKSNKIGRFTVEAE